MKIKKHNFSAFVCAFMALSLLSFGFTSCKNEDDDDDSSVRTYKIPFDTVGKTYLTSDTSKLSNNPSVQVNSGSTFKESDISAALANYSFFEGYAISGWYFDSDYTSPFSEFTVNKSKTLYAKLTKDGNDVTVYKISYNTLDSINISDQLCSGRVTRANYATGNYVTFGIEDKIFCGWYYDESYASPVMLGDTISENKTFYAKWLNVSDLTVETPSSGVSFLQDSTNISDLAANGAICKRKSDDYDQDVGERIYEVISTPKVAAHNYFTGGVHEFAGALIWSPCCHHEVGFYTFNRDPVITNNDGIKVQQNSATLFSSDDTSKINFSLARSFVMVNMPIDGSVEVGLINNTSSDNTTAYAKAYMVTSDGTILNQVTIDNQKSTGDTDYTLSASGIEKDTNLFVVFCRNGDTSGTVRVKTFTFTEE